MSIVAQRWLDQLTKLTSQSHYCNSIFAVMSAAKRFVKYKTTSIVYHLYQWTVYLYLQSYIPCVLYLMANSLCLLCQHRKNAMEFIRNRFCNFLDQFFCSDISSHFWGRRARATTVVEKLGYITCWIGVFVATLWSTQPSFLSSVVWRVVLFATRTSSTMDTFSCSMNYDADQNGANEEYHFPLPIIYCLSVYLKHLSRILFAMLDNIACAAAIPNAWVPLFMVAATAAATVVATTTIVPTHLYISTGLNIRKVFDNIQIHTLNHIYTHTYMVYPIQTCKWLHTNWKQ